MKPTVETIAVWVQADGLVHFEHYHFGDAFERLVPASIAASYRRESDLPEESSAVEGGSAAIAAAHSEQYTAREPLARIDSLPQRSQYLISNASTLTSAGLWTGGMACAALFITFLCGLMRAC